MQNAKLVVSGLVAIMVSAVAVSWWARERAASEHDVILTFSAQAQGAPIVFDTYAYDNPAGPGRVRLRDFRFYLSNISLESEEAFYVEPNSYHLVRFDNPEASDTIRLEAVPLNRVARVAFSIGVDAEANSSIEVRGDLDPNSQMAWNWEVGYKFVMFEGNLMLDDQEQPLVYHVGFSENRRELLFELDMARLATDLGPVHFVVDVMKLFEGTTQIDLSKLTSVKFDREDAGRLADNYARMIELAD